MSIPTFNSEPVAIIGAIEALALALIGLVALLADWSPDTTAAIVAVVGPAIAVIGAVFARSRVSPVE